MEGFNQFCQSNLTIIYGLYGLAFFVTGLAVALESQRTSKLALARALPFFSAFGLTHGVHKWVEMFALLSPVTPTPPTSQIVTQAINISLLACSFIFLVEFAVRLIRLLDPQAASGRSQVTVALVVLYLSVVAGYRLVSFRGDELAFWNVADILARYLLGLPGAALACWAMFVQRRVFLREGLASVGPDLIGAALALAWYAFFQVFVPPAGFFPANVVNAGVFQNYTGIPVQLFRAGVVGLLAFFIIRVMRVFELEYARRLEAVNRARFEAQEQAARELSVLYETTRILGTTLDLNVLLEEATRKIVTLVEPVRAATVYLHDPAEHALVACATARRPEAQLSAEYAEMALGLARAAFETRETMYKAVSNADSIVAIPLVSSSDAIGALALAHAEAFSNFAVLQTLARQLVIAIQNARLYAQVQEKEVLRGQLLERVVAAQEDERKRLARDLHDQTGQVLTGLGLGLSSLTQILDQNPALAYKRLTELQGLCAGAIDELRGFVTELRPSLLDDLGLVAALRAMAEQVEERAPLDVYFHVNGNPRTRLRPEIETVLYRIAQEALNNTVRHAQARKATMDLDFQESVILLVISDDGVGFSPGSKLKARTPSRPWGLLGIQERVELVGGTAEIYSLPGQGTRVTVRIPCDAAEGQGANEGTAG